MKNIELPNTTIIEDLIFSLGIRPSQKGFHQLAYALRLALDNEDRLICVSQRLFSIITTQCGTSSNTIDHNIKRIIKTCWYSAEGKRKLTMIAPTSLENCPTVTEFLDILYWAVKRMETGDLTWDKLYDSHIR